MPITPTRGEQIAEEIRMQIVRGEMAPGSRLPTWGDYGEKYQVTRTTLNRVFARLKNEGFVYSSSTSGTFVSENPPHLSRYGIVFSQRPGSSGFNRFWWTLANEAVVLAQAGGREFPCFYGVEDHADNESHNELLTQARLHRLAGLILIGNPNISPELRYAKSLPKVAAGMAGPEAIIPCVDFDHNDFLTRAVNSLAKTGRRKVAILTTADETYPQFEKIAKAAGVMHKPYWRLAVSVHHPETAKPIVHLLMSAPPEERPDGLIIADDNMVEAVCSALIETGTRVPSELEIISHCNWPHPIPAVLPGRRLGCDTRHLLEVCLGQIDAQRHNQTPPIQTLVPAVFEDEYNQQQRPDTFRA